MKLCFLHPPNILWNGAHTGIRGGAEMKTAFLFFSGRAGGDIVYRGVSIKDIPPSPRLRFGELGWGQRVFCVVGELGGWTSTESKCGLNHNCLKDLEMFS